MSSIITRIAAAAISSFMIMTPMSPTQSYLRFKSIFNKSEEKNIVVNDEEAKSKISELNNKKRDLFPGIVCWGDSLTAGAGGNGTSYPSALEAAIKENILGKFNLKTYMNASDKSNLNWNDYSLTSIPVINMGIGGERSDTIAGRADAIPLKVNGFVIPEDKIKTPITFIASEGQTIEPLLQGDKQFNPVSISGVKGKISFETTEEGIHKYFFTRSSAGDETIVENGSEIITASSGKYRDYIQVIMMGGNGGFSTLDELFEQYDAVIARQEKNGDKYIIVGYHGRLGAVSQYENFDELMSERYGDKYLPTIDYLLSEQAFKDAGIDITEQDKTDISNGVCPTSFLVDGVHFNAKGYTLIGNLIYERMDQLGYFDDLKSCLTIN